jgi:hypothetical protein
VADPPSALNAKNLSGAQRQPNGNTLLCAGATGDAWEVRPDGELVWRYVCPVSAGGPVAQGSSPTNNQLFRLPRLVPAHPGLAGKVLVPGPTIQLEPEEPECVILSTGIPDPGQQTSNLFIHPSPFQDQLWVNSPAGLNFRLRVLDATGRLVYDQLLPGGSGALSTENWPAGVYVAYLLNPGGPLIGRNVLVKPIR